MATTKQTPKQAAYLFFLKNAGYSYTPGTETPKAGRSRCARELAKAERDAAALGYYFEWCNDWDGCIGCDCGEDSCSCSTGEPHECLVCQIFPPESESCAASLGSICEPSREYRRVIEAELALEALAQ